MPPAIADTTNHIREALSAGFFSSLLVQLAAYIHQTPKCAYKAPVPIGRPIADARHGRMDVRNGRSIASGVASEFGCLSHPFGQKIETVEKTLSCPFLA
jgi:hypothetical protein